MPKIKSKKSIPQNRKILSAVEVKVPKVSVILSS